MPYLQVNYQNKFDISDSGCFHLLIFYVEWIEKLEVVLAISCLLVLLLLFRVDICGG